jgi:hypothetical protein
LYLRDGHDKLLVYCWGGCCPASAVLVELRKRGLLDHCHDRPVHPSPPQRHSHSDISRAPANRIWAETVDPRDTLVECYFTGRGFTFPHRGEEAIRFHPHCPFKGERVPTMVALLRDTRTNEPCGIHRTALLPNGHDRDRVLGRAMLGRASGAAIKISPDDAVTLGIGIAEGVETALAIILSGWRPVWAAASASGIAQFPLLSGIEELTIFADRDGVGQQAAQKCAQRWRDADRLATILPAPGAYHAWP